MPTRVHDSTVLDPSRAASPAVLLISGFLFFQREISGDSLVMGLIFKETKK
jgi:hypothetical protein